MSWKTLVCLLVAMATRGVQRAACRGTRSSRRRSPPVSRSSGPSSRSSRRTQSGRRTTSARRPRRHPASSGCSSDRKRHCSTTTIEQNAHALSEQERAARATPSRRHGSTPAIRVPRGRRSIAVRPTRVRGAERDRVAVARRDRTAVRPDGAATSWREPLHPARQHGWRREACRPRSAQRQR